MRGNSVSTSRAANSRSPHLTGYHARSREAASATKQNKMTINPTFSVCVCVLVIKKLREKMKKRVGNVIERPRQAVMKAVNVQVVAQSESGRDV